jgi:hypothetical protein
MTATGSPRHKGRNWTTGEVYCDEPSDPANPGPLPISTPPSMLQCRMQKRLMRIGTDIVNVEMVTDDGVASQHNIKICRILMRYKAYVDECSKDMANSRTAPFTASKGNP